MITVIQFPDPRAIAEHRVWTMSDSDSCEWGIINIKQPRKIIRAFFTFFTFFLKIQKNMTFYVFWVVAHVFSNIAIKWIEQFCTETEVAVSKSVGFDDFHQQSHEPVLLLLLQLLLLGAHVELLQNSPSILHHKSIFTTSNNFKPVMLKVNLK